VPAPGYVLTVPIKMDADASRAGRLNVRSRMEGEGGTVSPTVSAQPGGGGRLPGAGGGSAVPPGGPGSSRPARRQVAPNSGAGHTTGLCDDVRP